jgi:hypothetical protein
VVFAVGADGTLLLPRLGSKGCRLARHVVALTNVGPDVVMGARNLILHMQVHMSRWQDMLKHVQCKVAPGMTITAARHGQLMSECCSLQPRLKMCAAYASAC